MYARDAQWACADADNPRSFYHGMLPVRENQEPGAFERLLGIRKPTWYVVQVQVEV